MHGLDLMMLVYIHFVVGEFSNTCDVVDTIYPPFVCFMIFFWM